MASRTLEGIRSITTALSEMSQRSNEASERLRNTGSIANEAASALEDAASRSMEASKRVQEETRRMREVALQETGDTATRLDDLIFKLEQNRDAIGKWGAGLIEQLKFAREGIGRTEDIMNNFGNGVIVIDGRLRLVKDLIQDVGDSTGQIQRQLGELSDAIDRGELSLEDLLARLGQSQLLLARQFAEVVRAYREGRVTLEEVIRQAQLLKQQFQGSEAELLADEITQALRTGALG